MYTPRIGAHAFAIGASDTVSIGLALGLSVGWVVRMIYRCVCVVDTIMSAFSATHGEGRLRGFDRVQVEQVNPRAVRSTITPNSLNLNRATANDRRAFLHVRPFTRPRATHLALRPTGIVSSDEGVANIRVAISDRTRLVMDFVDDGAFVSATPGARLARGAVSFHRRLPRTNRTGPCPARGLPSVRGTRRTLSLCGSSRRLGSCRRIGRRGTRAKSRRASSSVKRTSAACT